MASGLASPLPEMEGDVCDTDFVPVDLNSLKLVIGKTAKLLIST